MEACSTSRRLLVSTLVLLVLGSLIKDVGAGRASPLRIPGIFSSQSGVSVPRKAPNTTLTSVGFFHTFRKPPWGGGNQFLMALAGEMRARGITVLDNKIEADKTKVYMANAITFKTDPFKAAMKKSKNKLKLVQQDTRKIQEHMLTRSCDIKKTTKFTRSTTNLPALLSTSRSGVWT